MGTTWGEYEAEIRRKNPKLFAADEIRITPDKLIKQLEAAWRNGHEVGVRKEKSVFQNIFG